jgi:hypothetical protein
MNPLFEDGGDGLQIGKLAANVLNKQSRTAYKGWSSSLGVKRRVKSAHRKITGPQTWRVLMNVAVTISFSRSILLHEVSQLVVNEVLYGCS